MTDNEIGSLITPDVILKILSDRVARIAITSQSHYWFFHLYFHEHVKYPTAQFQKEMFMITEDDNVRMAIIVAFRGSAKSTIMTMSFPLWAVLGRLQKKCVVIISQTQQQARTHFSNLKRELEANDLLRRDLGPFEEASDEWGSYSIVIPKFNARLVAASSEQSIRGIRHGSHRPDLIICDDVEDITSVKTKDARDRAYTWLTGDIFPLGDKNTKTIIIGNLLHEDSLLMRLRKNIETRNIDAIYKQYPLVGEDNRIMWPGKFTNLEEILTLEKSIGNDKAWQREFMLKIVPEDDQLVLPEWITYYDELPKSTEDYRYTIMAIDLAISTSASADFTAIVTAHVYGNLDTLKVYILPNPVNRKMDYPTTLAEIKELSRIKYFGYHLPKVLIEEVGYQASIIQQLHKENFNVKGFKVHGRDKRARLNSVTPMIRFAQVLFPRDTCKELVHQLVYFGTENHDDLVDAFSMLLLEVIAKDQPPIVFYKDIY